MEVEIKKLHQLFLESEGVTTDTRSCKPGTIFFALKGATFDGNKFALKALESGCSYAVVDCEHFSDDPRLIYTENVLQTLQKLAAFHRDRFRIPVVAITGTNGKTTTKELLNTVLRRKYNVLCTEGNLNNQIGVPLTLLRITDKHQIAIIEMGASHPGDIAELCQIAHPSHGIITNVGKAHLQGFGSFEGVIRTKSELYKYLIASKGTVFINPENNFLTTALGKYHNIVEYTSRAELIPHQPTLTYRWSGGNVRTNLCGDYNMENLLAVMTIGSHFNVPREVIHEAIGAYVPSNNRSQFHKTERNMLILDVYNANPTSMTASINNFSKMECQTVKIAILGDMLELGESSVAEHRTIIEKLRNSTLDNVYLVGGNFGEAAEESGERVLPASFRLFPDVPSLMTQLRQNPISNATVLLKASRGIALEKCIDLL